MLRIALAIGVLFGCGDKTKPGEEKAADHGSAPVAENNRVTYNNDVAPVLTDARIEALLKAHADHGGVTKVADTIGVMDDVAKLDAAADALARKVGFADMKEYELVSD